MVKLVSKLKEIFFKNRKTIDAIKVGDIITIEGYEQKLVVSEVKVVSSKMWEITDRAPKVTK